MLILKLLFHCFLLNSLIDAFQNCPYLRLPNGKIRYSNQGRKAKFSCFRPHTLVGESRLQCVHGEWNGSIPVCARKTCEPLPKLLHGKITYSNDRAVAKLQCNPDFTLIGSPFMYCGVLGWNDTTTPDCQANSIHQFRICDFEPGDEKQCGWISTPMLFNWTIMSSNPQDNVDIPTDTYPNHDHTLEPHSGGHFLYLETLVSLSKTGLKLMNTRNPAAKYISPLFPPIDVKAELHCLIFYLFINGSHPGVIEVFINKDIVWRNDGSLGAEWKKISIPLRYQPNQFRVIIEGKGELGQLTNTAIDDLKITSGNECREQEIPQGEEFPSEATQVFAELESITTDTLSERKNQNILNFTTENTSTSENVQKTLSTSTNYFSEKPYTQEVSNTPVDEDSTKWYTSSSIKDIKLTSSIEITFTETNIVYHDPAGDEISDNDNIEPKHIPEFNSTFPKSMKDYNIVNETSNASVIAQEIQHDNQALGNEMAHLEYYFVTKKVHESSNFTHWTPVSDNTVVKANNTKYEYNHHEENNRNEVHQKGNDRHLKNAESNLKKKFFRHVDSINSSRFDKKIYNSNFLQKKVTPNESLVESNSPIIWVLLLAAFGGIAVISAGLSFIHSYKKYNSKYYRNKEENSFVQFISKENSSSSSFRKPDDILVLNYVGLPHKMS